MRSVLSRYPSSINQAALLSEAGFRVWICDVDDRGHAACAIPPGVQRQVLEVIPDLYAKVSRWRQGFSGVSRRLFHSRLRQTLNRVKPDLVISYDPPALAALCRLYPRRWPFLHIWHCHEVLVEIDDMGWGTRRDIRLAAQSLARLDAMIVPDRERAQAYFSDAELKRPPFIVMNCPRKVLELPRPALKELLSTRGIADNAAVILYVGSVGPAHGLRTAAASMHLWPQNSVFVLAGPVSTEYRAELERFATEAGMSGRIIFLGAVPYDAWEIRAGADLALTVMNIESPIYKYCAGASNKRFEAMAAGVAQVTNEGPGIADLFVHRGVARAVPHDDPERMGRGVSSLLTNAASRSEMGKKARELHLSDYNYERQFLPVLTEIERLIPNTRVQ